MSSFWTRQPGTAVYTIFFVAFTLLRLPWLFTLYLFPSMRPNSSWTFRQSLSRTLFVYFGKYVATVELKAPPLLKAGNEKGQFVIAQPARGALYCGILLCDPLIRPGKVGAVWHTEPITRPGQHQRGQRVFFHIHGGAYVLGDGRDVGIKFMSSLLLRSSPGCAIFCPEYRLASAPVGRFPAAFQDTVTAYSHLVHELQIPPQDIILSGDSAGAHLAIGLLRYANANPDILPEPAAMLLWSPWPDMVIEVAIADERPATHVDHVAPELIAWTYREFLPRAETGVARSDPYISPVTAAVPTEVPIWVQWGGAEILRPEIVNFVNVQQSTQSRHSRGTKSRVGTYEVAHAPHDILTLAPMIGWKAEATEAVEQAVAFLDESLPFTQTATEETALSADPEACDPSSTKDNLQTAVPFPQPKFVPTEGDAPSAFATGTWTKSKDDYTTPKPAPETGNATKEEDLIEAGAIAIVAPATRILDEIAENIEYDYII